MTGVRSRVAILGQGYVGLPAAKAAVHAGHTVVGVDTDLGRISTLANGRSPIDDVTDADVAAMMATGRYLPTTDADELSGFDVALITVPTPLREGRPDLTHVLTAARTLAATLTAGALVVLESTVAPGTTDGELRAVLEDNPARHSVQRGDLLIAFSPERIDPGNPTWGFRNTPKLVGGLNSASTAAAEGFYATICDTVVRCASAATAEMAKLLENTYRHVNIALVNELGRHAHELGVSIWDVVDAAATKPFGYQPFYTGPGVGGHCLPVDPAYLSDRIERSLGRPFDFVDLAMRVNDAQPAYVAERVVRLLNTVQQAVNGSRVLILGLAYKANSGDTRETPAASLINLLRDLGAIIHVADPRVPDLDARLAAQFCDVKPVPAAGVVAAASQADLTILVTDHSDFDYPQIQAAARLILDTRNRFDRSAHVHKL